MHVHHRDRIKNVRLYEPPERDHDAQLGADIDDVVDAITDRQTVSKRRSLHRRWDKVGTPAAPPIGLSHNEQDLVARLDQRLERGHRSVG